MSTVDTTGDWTTWTASPPIEVLTPDAPYECAPLPVAPSEAGDLKGAARQEGPGARHQRALIR